MTAKQLHKANLDLGEALLNEDSTKREIHAIYRKLIPDDPNQWTFEDWRDLRRGIEAIKRKVAKRHAKALQEKGSKS